MIESEKSASPPTLPLDPHRFRDLFGARSVVGALVVVSVLSWFSFGIEMLDGAIRDAEGFTVGAPRRVTAAVAFTPADGWVNDADQTVPDVAVVALKDGWNVKLTGAFALQPGQTIEDLAKIFHDIPQADAGAVVTDLESFTTTSGLHGVSWHVNGTTTSSSTWLIASESGSTVAQVLTEGPSAGSSKLEPEVVAMAKSVTIADATEGASQ